MAEKLCRDCGEPIEFRKNSNDRWFPADPATGKSHRCMLDQRCESCGKKFRGADWMKVCGDCYRAGQEGEESPKPAGAREPLNSGGFDDDVPPF